MGFKEIPPKFQNIRIYDVSEKSEGQVLNYDCSNTGTCTFLPHKSSQLDLELDCWHSLDGPCQNEEADLFAFRHQGGLHRSEKIELKAWRFLGGLFRKESVGLCSWMNAGDEERNEIVATYRWRFLEGLLRNNGTNVNMAKKLEVVETYYLRFIGGILRNEVVDVNTYEHSDLINTNVDFNALLKVLKEHFRDEYIELLSRIIFDNDTSELNEQLELQSLDTTDGNILVQVEDLNLQNACGELPSRMINISSSGIADFLNQQTNHRMTEENLLRCDGSNPDVCINLNSHVDWRSIAIDEGAAAWMNFGGIDRIDHINLSYLKSQYTNICAWKNAFDEEQNKTQDCNGKRKGKERFNVDSEVRIFEFWRHLGGVYENEVVDASAWKYCGGNEMNECVDLSGFKLAGGLVRNEATDLGAFKFAGGLVRNEAADLTAFKSAGISRNEDTDLCVFQSAGGYLINEALDLSAFKATGGLLRNGAEVLSAFRFSGDLSVNESDDVRIGTIFGDVNDRQLEEIVQKEYIDLSAYANEISEKANVFDDDHLELSDFESDFVYLSDCDYIPK